MSVLKHPTKEEGEARLKEYYAKMDWFTAIRNHAYDRVEELIRQGCDTMVVNRDGMEALMMAVLNNDSKMVEILVRNGANPHVIGICGESPWLVASSIMRPHLLLKMDRRKYLNEIAAKSETITYGGYIIYDGNIRADA